MLKRKYETPELFLQEVSAQDICTVSYSEEGNALEFDLGNLGFQ